MKYILLIIILVQSVGLFLTPIALDNLIKIIDTSVSFSAVVFTVEGIWLAIIFPNVLTQIYRKDKEITEKEALLKESYILLKPLLFGMVLLLISIIFRVLVEIKLPFFSNEPWFLSMRFPFTVLLIEAIAYNLASALSPGINLYFSAAKELKIQQRKNRLFSNTSKK